MVEPTRKDMHVLTHYIFYEIMWICVYSVYFLVVPTPIHGLVFIYRGYIEDQL